jgi:3-oxoacyl-[acyl-carrier-protein] synthase-3
MSWGIAALGYALGEPRVADPSIVERWGFRRFHVAGAGTGLTDLAVQAGQRALDRAGVDAQDVDLVVLAMSDIAEYLYWDAAAATQARVGAHRAEAVLVNQACASGVVSLDTVAGRFATHPDYRTALVVAANRVCEAYWNRMESTASICSDGAAAAVLRRDHPAARWLATATITDGRYADMFRLETGGAARPFTTGEPAAAPVANPFNRLYEVFGCDHRAMLRFVDTVRSRTGEVFRRACGQAGVAPEAVKRVIHQNDNVRALAEVAEDLGLPLSLTNVDIAVEHGHLGCADQLFSLARQFDDGALVTGDLVALTSVGGGMHWACTLLRI